MVIGNPFFSEENGWTYLNCEYQFSSKSGTLFWGVQNYNASALDRNTIDCALIGLIQIAAKYNEPICIKGGKITKQLVENITEKLLPAFEKMGLEIGKVLIEYEPSDSYQKASGVATGISLGIDSSYSILHDLSSYDNASLITVLYEREKVGEDYEWNNLERHQRVAEELGYKLLPIVTNLRFVGEQELAFEQVHTFCHSACAMALKGAIGTYLYASGYSNSDNHLSFHDSSCYDLINQEVMSFNGFQMKISGGDVTRTEKTQYLAEFPIIQENLCVCLKPMASKKLNCSFCNKCIRTMVTLDVIGKLDKFEKVFDVQEFRNSTSRYWGHILHRVYIAHDPLAKEILEEARLTGYKVKLCYYFSFIIELCDNQKRKVVRKIKKMLNN